MSRRNIYKIIDDTNELTQKSMQLFNEMVGHAEVVTLSKGEFEQYLKNVIYHLLMEERGHFHD